MPERDLKFLGDHPEMIDHDAITTAASNDVIAAGIKYDSPDYPHAVKKAFDTRMRHLQAQGAAQAPEFFRPPPIKEKSVPDAAYYTSAPVSRGPVGGGGSYQPSNPRQVRLSPEEKAIAQASGISEIEYARNKIRLQQEKARGERL